MIEDACFGPEDIQTIKRVMADLSTKARRGLTLDGLLADWESFVSAVDRGYGENIYEYTNELSIRDLLEHLMGSLTAKGQGRLAEVVRPIDERFLAATVRAAKPLLPSAGDARRGLWWYRIPRKVPPALKLDLERDGFM